MNFIAEAFTDPSKLFTVGITIAQAVVSFTVSVVNQSFDFAGSLLQLFV